MSLEDSFSVEGVLFFEVLSLASNFESDDSAVSVDEWFSPYSDDESEVISEQGEEDESSFTLADDKLEAEGTHSTDSSSDLSSTDDSLESFQLPPLEFEEVFLFNPSPEPKIWIPDVPEYSNSGTRAVLRYSGYWLSETGLAITQQAELCVFFALFLICLVMAMR